jgi:hypothetical protein
LSVGFVLDSATNSILRLFRYQNLHHAINQYSSATMKNDLNILIIKEMEDNMKSV